MNGIAAKSARDRAKISACPGYIHANPLVRAETFALAFLRFLRLFSAIPFSCSHQFSIGELLITD